MQRQQVTFVAQRSIMHAVPIPNAYEFKPVGRFAWLQRLLWRFLLKCGVLIPAERMDIEVVRHPIDADGFMQQLIAQKAAILQGYNREPKTLLIGSDDYSEWMNSPEACNQYFEFGAQYRDGPRLFGLQVRVIPWMRGMLVMP